MSSERQLIDTNVVVRFLSGDPPEMAAKARRLVEAADRGETTLLLVPVILAEVFFTLESFYEIDRKIVAQKLLALLECRGIDAIDRNRSVVALKRCEAQGAHFADAFLAAVALETGDPIASFDRDFDRFRGVMRIEPE